MFDHFQFALIHGPNIPGSYAILLFTALDLASITSHIHSWVELRRHSRLTTGISAVPLGWPWEAQSSPRVARESWGLRSSLCRAEET